jgi:hypothetical protein
MTATVRTCRIGRADMAKIENQFETMLAGAGFVLVKDGGTLAEFYVPVALRLAGDVALSMEDDGLVFVQHVDVPA